MDEHIARILREAEHPVLNRMLLLWDEKRAGRLLPKRSDFDPVEMKFALGDINLYDVHENPRRFWCRLDGTRQVELFGVDCTRRYLDECLAPDYYQLNHRSFCAVVDARKPGYSQRSVLYAGRPIRYEVVILPMSEAGEQVDKLMVALTPHWE
jgi:hypothetical protein